MARPPFFTVLVPTYNQAQYLGQALDSLLAQTDSDWEAVVVNDGSTDSTAEVLKTYCARDRRFRGLHKENGGVGSALNAGLREASGEWICWLSSDDLFDKHKLAIHRDWIGRDPSCRFFFTHARRLDEATGRITDAWLSITRDRAWQVLEMLRSNYVYGNSICVHRDAWGQAGTFKEELRYAQDYDMWLRLMALYPATFIPERTCITRIHGLRDSGRFPEAGGFDCAAAALRFLNEHSFAELVPWADLRDSRVARNAIARALDVAADPSAFVHRLGPNAALLFRIMEWAWGERAAESAERLQRIVQRRSDEASCQYSGTAFGFLWKAAAVASRLPRRRFNYRPLSPATVAETNYWLLKSSGAAEAEPLHRYLERFENLSLPKDAAGSPGKVTEVVIVCPEKTRLTGPTGNGALRAAIEAARNLTKSGRAVLLTGLSDQGIGFIDGVLFVGAEDEDSWARAVASLGPVDALVGISRGDIHRMACARRYLDLEPESGRVVTPGLVQNGLSGGSAGAALSDTILLLPVRTSALRFTLCRVWRRGQVGGTLRRTRDWIAGSRAGLAVTMVWHRISGKPVIEWPAALRSLWIERGESRRRARER